MVLLFDQDYAQLCKLYKGANASPGAGKLFVDDKFPADAKALGPALSEKYANVVWKRPYEINAKARLLCDGKPSANNVVQGHVGNCWLVTACSVLAGSEEFFDEVVPDKDAQDKAMTDASLYAGVFLFRFWRMGKQHDVVVDDLLPVNADTNELIFARSTNSDEYWASLLEKAYAKLNGSYEHLDSGSSADAMVDFTNGVIDVIDLGDQAPDPKLLYQRLTSAYKYGCLMTASIGDTDVAPDKKGEPNEFGLVPGHAYAITAIERVKHAGFFNFDHFEMIRLRNPWGHGEWNGAWSDKSEEWKKVSDADKKELGLVSADDGDFWMSMVDFAKHFGRAVICRVVNTSLLSSKSTYLAWNFYGAWTKLNSGGCTDHADTFLKNPQFALKLQHKSRVILGLMQDDHRGQLGPDNAPIKNESIGYVVIRTEENRTVRLHELTEIVHKVTYIDARQLSSRCNLEPGNYVIVPTTFEQDKYTSFLLRVFVETSLLSVSTFFADCKPLTLTKAKPPMCKTPYTHRITVKVGEAKDLVKQDFLSKGADPYLVISVFDVSDGCCGIHSTSVQKVRGMVTCDNTRNPKFGEDFVFFSHSLDRTRINIQVWNSNVIRYDTFMGEINIAGEDAATGGNEGKFVPFNMNLASRPLTNCRRSPDDVEGTLACEVREEKV